MQSGCPVVATMAGRLIRAGWLLKGIVIRDLTIIHWLSMTLPSIRVLVNENPETGPIGSLGLATNSENVGSAGILCWPVDHPLVSTETLARLRESSDDSSIAVPNFEGKHGHTTWWGTCSWDLLRSSLADEGANRVLRSGLISIQEVFVDDQGVTINIDTFDVAAAHGLEKAE